MTRISKLLLYAMPSAACIALMGYFAFAGHELPNEWQLLALIAILFIWSSVSDWLIRRDGKNRQTIWKDVMSMVIAFIFVVLASLLAGWTGGKFAEMYGSRVFGGLFLALGIISIINLMRRGRLTAADDQRK